MFRELQVAKNKDGPCGRMLLDFDPEHMSFSYRAPQGGSDVGKQLRAEGKKVRQRNVAGQTSFEELPDDAGGELPF